MSVHRKDFNNMRQEENENFNHWVMRLRAKMNMCSYRIPCDVADCPHEHNYGEILVEESMIVNMYDQEASNRIMADHDAMNTYDKKYARVMSLQEATRYQEELVSKASASQKRSDYKSQ